MDEKKVCDEAIHGIEGTVIYVSDASSDFLDSFLEQEEENDG